MAYHVQILDKNRNPITEVTNLVPLDQHGTILEYSQKLSDYGRCKFRVGTKDPFFTVNGDVLQPYVNHVRIKRNNFTVWQGIIVNQPRRNKNYIEVQAYTYLFLLSNILIRHDTTGDTNYRTFSTGTMDQAISALLTESKADSDAASIIRQMTTGTIENPQFPSHFAKTDGTPLTGPWMFSTDVLIKFDFRTVLYAIKALGAYSNCDFELTNDMVFNFKHFLGKQQPSIVFNYGETGQIEDYNVPLNGEGMANHLLGVARNFDNQILHEFADDTASIQKYGTIAGVAGYIDIKNINALRGRLNEELRFISTPDTEIHIILNERAYPLGQYNNGDVVTIIIKDHIIDVNAQRIVVNTDVKVQNTGKETIQLITNVPRPTT